MFKKRYKVAFKSHKKTTITQRSSTVSKTNLHEPLKRCSRKRFTIFSRSKSSTRDNLFGAGIRSQNAGAMANETGLCELSYCCRLKTLGRSSCRQYLRIPLRFVKRTSRGYTSHTCEGKFVSAPNSQGRHEARRNLIESIKILKFSPRTHRKSMNTR